MPTVYPTYSEDDDIVSTAVPTVSEQVSEPVQIPAQPFTPAVSQTVPEVPENALSEVHTEDVSKETQQSVSEDVPDGE